MEYFVAIVTFPAPFFGEQYQRYIEGDTPEGVLLELAEKSGHVYSASAFASADDYHKKRPSLARYESNRAAAEKKAQSLRFMGHRDDGSTVLEINGEEVVVQNPTQGSIVEARRD